MTVIYFTATGNSLAVAKKIADRLISLTELLHENTPVEISDKEGIGLLLPVYFGQIPLPVAELLPHLKLKAPYLFAVLTYGEVAGRAATHMRRLGLAAGLRFNYIRTIKMVDNNFTIVNVEKQTKDCKRKKIPAHMETIAGDIYERQNYIEKPGLINRIIGWFEERIPQNPMFDAGFSVENNKCNGCGTCAKVCPVNNVDLRSGLPVWEGHCVKCTACYHNCPQGAICYRKERSRYCYRNPDVSLKEIIKANNFGEKRADD